MVFSFFKKPPEKMVARPAVTPRPALREEALPLAEAPATPAVEEEDAALDDSDFPFSAAPSDFQDEAEVDPLDADIGQAALLYANGQDATVRAMLESAVQIHRSGADERVWRMLFDLYRLLGEKAAFEVLSVDYAAVFASSPPAWRDASPEPLAAAAARAASMLFKGELLGSNDAGFGGLQRALEEESGLQLDLSQVNELDAAGCGRLLALLQKAHKAGVEVGLLGRDGIGAQIEGRIETGLAEDGECWLLLLELYQLQGQQEAFDDVAINYAVTFEVSPPSWEAQRVAAAGSPPVLPSTVAADDASSAGAYVVRGAIKSSRFADLPAFAEPHDPVLIDCSALSRIDFISAGALLNVLATLRRCGKKIVIQHPNHLVAELFGLVGLKAVAEINFEKF